MTDLFDDQQELERPTSRQRRSDQQHAAKRHKRAKVQRRRNVVTFVVMLLSLGLLVGGAYALISPLLGGGDDTEQAITDYPGPGSGEVEVVVNPGDTGSDIGRTLVDANVVATVGAFTEAYQTNQRATQIQAGHYTLQEEMAAADAVQALLDPGTRSDLTVTIPEGWTVEQIYERVANRFDVPLEDVQAAGAAVADEELPDIADGEIEGWLFPATYTVEPDSAPDAILRQMVQRSIALLEDREVPTEEWEIVLNKASIVELEVFQADYRPLVAEVVDNRLAGCSEDGFLGMDSTYAYGLDKPAATITTEEWATDHPYNGRRISGLPPTPIANPGEESIDAVLNPSDGDYCYFVTVNLDTGETKFAETREEHEQNAREFREWRDSQGSNDDEDDA